MNSNLNKPPAWNLTITGLILAGILALPSLGHAEEVTHSYDDLNRLIRSDYGNGKVIDYTYDAAGNRTSQKVTVPNKPPIANAGPDQTVPLGSVVILNGSASTDPTPGTSPLSYAWSQTQGPKVTLNGPNTAKPTFQPMLSGVYKFSLTVKDGQTTSAPATVTITVQDVPIVVLSPNGGEVWKVNTAQTINWYTSKALVNTRKPVTIRLSQDGDDHWTVIAKEVRDSGTYKWKPSKKNVTNQARISVCLLDYKKEKDQQGNNDKEDNKGSGICDGSDANFKIIK